MTACVSTAAHLWLAGSVLHLAWAHSKGWASGPVAVPSPQLQAAFHGSNCPSPVAALQAVLQLPVDISCAPAE